MNPPRLQLFRIGDIFFWMILLCGAFLIWRFIANTAAGNSLAIVEINGEVKYRIDLKKEGEYELDEFNPPVKLWVREGRIAVTENNCPQKICMRMGYISRPGQMIACVPKKILIYVPARYEKEKPVRAITG